MTRLKFFGILMLLLTISIIVLINNFLAGIICLILLILTTEIGSIIIKIKEKINYEKIQQENNENLKIIAEAQKRNKEI